MLDILISLCLIFALFAGLVSGISEIFAQVIGLRAKVLYQGVAVLLGDLPNSYAQSGGLLGFFRRRLLEDLGWKSPGRKLALTDKLYGNPLIDTLSQPNSKPSYIPAATFAGALLNTLSMDGSCNSLRGALDDRSSHLGKLFGPMLDSANGDVERFKAQVESHFNLITDRVSGWYKRRTQFAMFFLALILAFGMNVDAIFIIKSLQADQKLVAQLVSTADKMNTSGLSEENKADLNASLKNVKANLDQITGLGLPIGRNIEKDQSFKWLLAGQDWPSAILGWLLTAAAATLGAPFWFDAISKLFAIRGAGVKPDTAQPAAASPAPVTVNLTSPPATPAGQETITATEFEATRLNGEDIAALRSALGLPEAGDSRAITDDLRGALKQWQKIKGKLANGRFDEETVLNILYPEQ